MINIASSQPVHWPVSPTAIAVEPVAAVNAVAPTQRSQGENQSGPGSNRQAQAHVPSNASQKKAPEQGKTAELAQAAPILPRDRPEGGQETGLSPAADSAAQQALVDQAAEEANSAQSLKLLDVLSTVWQASAAVVERALGRDESGVDGVGASELTKPADQASAVDRQGLGDTAGAQMPGATEGGGDNPGSLEPPTSYTEQGASEWGGLEVGHLVSKRA